MTTEAILVAIGAVVFAFVIGYIAGVSRRR